METVNNNFKVKSLIMSMYKTLEDNHELTDDIKAQYNGIMSNYHESILDELNNSLMSNSRKVRRYEEI